jgi:hypothetical protein
VVVVVVDDVVVDGLGLVVVVVIRVVVDEALGCGRVGSGVEVELVTLLDHDVVAEMRAPLVGASVRLPPTPVGPALGSVVVGPATPAPEPIVSGPTPTA